MQVSRLGDELVVRLPAGIVEVLSLKEGDEVDIIPRESADEKPLMTREEALAQLDRLPALLPPGFRFRRDELYDQPRLDLERE